MLTFCGCYYNSHVGGGHVVNYRKYLPLQDTEAHTTILSTTSRTVLKQTFKNVSSIDAIKDCVYVFPLYDGVSVIGFTCRIGDRVLRGLVKEKAKAKEIFNKAVAGGETAGLLEQSSEASDVFRTRLGNIPAGGTVIVEITYIGELKHHETDSIRFTIPTSIAPRYGGTNDTVTNHLIREQGIKISVDVSMPDGTFIKGVQSPSHPIAVSMGTLSTAVEADPVMSKASATLSLGSAALEKDFVLIVQSNDIGSPRAILETHPTIPNHRALMTTLVPKFSLPPSRPEIVFVADRSGSMSANISMLISAMKVFLKSMPVGVNFNICSFGSSATFLWPRSRSYSSETLQEAATHVDRFAANMGGTETFSAIKDTIERRFTDLPLEIILLTDGDIWQQENLLSYVNEQVKKTDGNIRIFPLGIGNGVSHSLIEGLARAGNGFAQSVQIGERLENCVVRMVRGALSPHITDYTLEVKYEKGTEEDFELIEKVTEGMEVLLHDNETVQSTQEKPEQPTISLFDPTSNPEKEDIKMEDADIKLPNIPYPKLLQSPHVIPTLFAFSRTTVYLLMSPATIQRNPTSVVLRATSTHGPLALEIPIEVLPTPAETIHQLAAKKAVQDLEEGRGWIFSAKEKSGVLVSERFPSCFSDIVQKEAVRLGEKFQVAGKWCSFVAVSANDTEIAAKIHRTSDDKMQTDSKDSDSEEKNDDASEDDFDTFEIVPSYSPQAVSAPPSASFPPSAMLRKRSPPRRSTGGFAARVLVEARKKPANGSAKAHPGAAGELHDFEQQNKKRLKGVTQQHQVHRTIGFEEIEQAQPMHFESCFTREIQQRGSEQYDELNFCNPERSTPPSQASMHAPKPSGGSIHSRGGLAPRLTRGSFGKSPPAPPSAPTPKADLTAHWASETAEERVLALISHQGFQGSWTNNDKEVPAILGFKVPPPPEGCSKSVWITLLSISFLEIKNSSKQGTWGLVVEKARTWLAENEKTGWQDWEHQARKFVSQL